MVQRSSSTVTLHTSKSKNHLPPPSSHMLHVHAHTSSLHTGVVRRVGEEMSLKKKKKQGSRELWCREEENKREDGVIIQLKMTLHCLLQQVPTEKHLGNPFFN